MGATPVYALPYPEEQDPADGPVDLSELANRLEAVIVPGVAAGQVPVWDVASKTWKPGVGVPPGSADGDVLTWNAASSGWIPQAPATVGAPTYPTRAFNTAYQASATHATLVVCQLYVQVNTAVGGSAHIICRIDATQSGAVAGTAPGQAYLNSQGGQVAISTAVPLIVPAGWWYYIQNYLNPSTANAIQTVCESTIT